MRRTSPGSITNSRRARRAALASMAAAAISAAAPAPARADPGAPRTRVQLEFVRGPGAEQCPDEQFLRAETMRHLGGADPYDEAAPLTVTASIERQRGELAATMFLRDRDGRGLWADGFSTRSDCTMLVSAMALSIAVLLDDAAELPAGPPAPKKPTEPAKPREAPCAPERPCSPQPIPAPRPSPRETSPGHAPARRGVPPVRIAPPEPAARFRWVAGLGAAVGFGLTPGVAVGPALSVGGRWPAWSATLEVRGLSSLSAEIEEVPMATSLLTTNAALCYHHHTLLVCGLSDLGLLRAATDVPLGAASLRNLRVGLGARIGAAWPVSERLSVRGYTDIIQNLADVAIERRPDAPGSDRSLWSASFAALAFGVGLHASL
ncbi:hypothetical protein [Sorangium sp. So ce131]|uniref:hypothetical protein n=1 Tax=Sorangium sp. So ce131 TaxID=3133282 RepID=UPI003F610F5D